MTAAILAETPHPGFEPPGIGEFFPPALVEFNLLGIDFEITRITVISWISILILLAVFVTAARKAQVVPGRLQFVAEGGYTFIRNGLARDVIGPEGVRFAPYLATLFFFILVNNLMGIIPFAQISPTSKIAIPAFLAAITYILFLYVGIRRQGFVGYFKNLLIIPGVPKALYVILVPLEFFSSIIARPFTLAIRLFANMMAGHLLLVVFTLGGVYLLTVPNFSVIFSPLSFLMALALTFVELLVQILQAYVFTILTATYLQESVSAGH